MSALFGALAGLAKSELIDRPKFQRDTQMRAIENQYAPIFNRAPKGFSEIQAPNSAQSAIDYGLAGAQFAQANKAAEDTASFRKDLLKRNQQPQMPQEQLTSVPAPSQQLPTFGSTMFQQGGQQMTGQTPYQTEDYSNFLTNLNLASFQKGR